MTSAAPLLQITDGTTRINLLDPLGFLLYDWQPAMTEAKQGGVWSDSPLFEGRKLAYRQFGNIADTFELKVRGYSQDDVIYKLQELRRLLEKAIQYWTSDAQNEPVYLKARAAYETNTRYAVIHDYRTPKEANPFAQPFFGCTSLMNDFLLSVEHGLWQDNVPGEGTCAEISAQQNSSLGIGITTDSPVDGTDDCYIFYNNMTATGTIYTTATSLIVGPGTNGYYNLGIRFPTVAVPNAAVILSAWIELIAESDRAGNNCITRVYGEDVDDSATFSTYANFAGRARTSAFVDWLIAPTLQGNTYSTPDLTAIVQEIVNRVGWATGQDMAFFVQDNGTSGYVEARRFAALENTSYTPAVLHIEYATSSPTYGQEATCEPGAVYVGNKLNTGTLTNVYKYDDDTGLYTDVLGDATPYEFMPSLFDTGDMVYFGSTIGPFNSLVFDISTIQLSGAFTWQYYNGATWATLTVTDHTAVTDPFDTLGVHSVHWVQPTAWAANAVNGVTAFWVRANATVGGLHATAPQQGNRDIYTCTWPYVDVAVDQIGGDIPALVEIKIANQSDAATGSPVLHANRIIIGARSLDRGEDFTAYLNVSDEQNPLGVTVTLGANTAYSNSSPSVTGRLATYSAPASATETTEVTFALDNTIAPDYVGRFRAFLRYEYQTGAADATALRLAVTPGGSGLAKVSDYFYPQNNSDFQIADFGIVNIPARSTSDSYGTITFEIKVTPDGTAGEVLYFHDLILIPVDEWSTDAVDESGNATVRNSAVGSGDLLDIDSVTYPRRVDQAVLRQVSDGRMIGYFQNRQPGPALLQANRAQRLWFLSMMYESGTEVSAPIAICHTVEVYRVNRYHSARGRR